MMTLLQWPWSISPSRNQTPGAIRRTVSGLASERETNRAMPARVVNSRTRNGRRRVMGLPPLGILYTRAAARGRMSEAVRRRGDGPPAETVAARRLFYATKGFNGRKPLRATFSAVVYF